jgi:hypothetical protein
LRAFPSAAVLEYESDEDDDTDEVSDSAEVLLLLFAYASEPVAPAESTIAVIHAINFL